MKTLLLSKQDVAQCVKPKDFLDAVEYVFREWGKGNIVQPVKITLDMCRSGADAWSNAMPAFIVPLGAAGIKWAGGFIENTKQNLPYVMASIILNDPQTGQVLAFMDGSLITNYRTGAAAAISAKYLGKKDIQRIAIVGAGTQGRTSVTCLSHIYPSAEVRVVDISSEKRRAFKNEMSRKTGMKIHETASVEEAALGAELIILVTTANEPLLKNRWIEEGATVLAMGSFPQTEPEFVLRADKIVVDSWGQTSHRGELLPLVEKGKISEKNIHAEIGEVVAGKKPGRESEKETILVIPIGLGSHDVCVAYHVYQRAKEKKLGTEFDLGLEVSYEF
jgi:alanine dehydrogenase